ncbi:MAG: hypothetical protein ABIK07_23535 [Planctomycetota bacterium]
MIETAMTRYQSERYGVRRRFGFAIYEVDGGVVVECPIALVEKMKKKVPGISY